MSKELEKARQFEAQEIKKIEENQKPAFHVSAPIGWINDPNGFSTYQGKVHLFYQYNPYYREWGPMHWGHSVTKDMIRWEQMPVALAPEQEYDKVGCFSGSAVEADGQHVLVYTGVTKVTRENGELEERQNQCIAFGNGENYTKAENNPVVTGDMMPEGCSRIDFRDPKIWKDGNQFYLIVGNKNEEQKGQVVLFSSEDLKQWKFETILAENSSGEIGTMWECPDFFQLGEKHILICSPQNMKAKGYEFHNGHNSVYFAGHYDSKKHLFEKEEPIALDYGLDFYAPQTTELPDGRRIMIAWMKSWDACIIPDEQQWQGMMTLPRELQYKNGQIYQYPVRELEKYHKNKCIYQNMEIENNVQLENIRGRMIDLTVEIKNGEYDEFQIELAHNKEYTTNFVYNRRKQLIEIDRTYSGVTKDVVCQRKVKISSQKEDLKLRFILDRCSIELFINDGQQVATTAISTPQEADEIIFTCDGSAVVNIEKYDIVV